MLREFFHIHKSDRRVILALLAVTAIALTVVFLAGGKKEANALSPTPAQTDLNNTGNQDAYRQREQQVPYYKREQQVPYYKQEQRTPERFAFDPNTADSTQLLRLGLQPWQVRNIYKYRSAGGIYRRKEDFARLYGLTVKQYRELEPFITISADYQPASTLFQDESHGQQRDSMPRNRLKPKEEQDTVPRYRVKLKEGETVDLATADTTELQKIPGIGPFFAHSIVRYGQQLGGYVSLSQLDEIEDFPQEAKSYLTLTPTPPRKLNINRLQLNELRHHPYINYYQARAILDYRRQHGTIADLQELHLLKDFPPEAIERLRPYVEY